MKLLITRPAIIAGPDGARAFYAGLTVEVDAATAEQILAQRAGIVVEPAPAPAPPTATAEIPVTLRRKKNEVNASSLNHD